MEQRHVLKTRRERGSSSFVASNLNTESQFNSGASTHREPVPNRNEHETSTQRASLL